MRVWTGGSLATASALPPVTTEMTLVFAIVSLALVLFVSEVFPVDVTALVILVVLIVLGPWTGVSVAEGLSGFSNEATITVLAMLILSEGVRRTGIVQLVGARVATLVGDSQPRQLAAVIGMAAPSSGFVNNTPVVALLVPVVTDLAHQGRTSPSKLLIPLSYASMLGGTLTLIGTSTNILASTLSARLLGRPFSMFEFTQVGLVVLGVGTVYLVTIAPRLLRERVLPREVLAEEFDVEEYRTEVVVREGSPLVGVSTADAFADLGVETDVLGLVRNGELRHTGYGTIGASTRIRAEDALVIGGNRNALAELVGIDGLDVLPNTIDEDDMEVANDGHEAVAGIEPESDPDKRFVEMVVPSGSNAVGEALGESALTERFGVDVFALRRGGHVFHGRLSEATLAVGDTLLVYASEETLERLAKRREFIVAHEIGRPDFRREKIPVAIAILTGVVGLAALDALPIVVSALAGVVAMVVAGVLRPGELYEGVDWSVIFLLAGVIPLGIAMTETGAAAFLGALVARSGQVLSPIAVLGLFYLLAAVLTNIISNNASVALMVPVAVSTAEGIGADPFAFVLAVTFAASTAFMTPIGYQTNLFVYGPGGYRFSDFFRVGAPLQLVLTVVTPLAIAFFFGL